MRTRGYRFYFYSHEPGEPVHVHVDKGVSSAKFWLEPVALAKNIGYTGHEIIEEHQQAFLEKWHEYFNQ